MDKAIRSSDANAIEDEHAAEPGPCEGSMRDGDFEYEHSEQDRALHTNGPRDVPRCRALSLLQKTLHYKGG